jgi:hypothetical protein
VPGGVIRPDSFLFQHLQNGYALVIKNGRLGVGREPQFFLRTVEAKLDSTISDPAFHPLDDTPFSPIGYCS